MRVVRPAIASLLAALLGSLLALGSSPLAAQSASRPSAAQSASNPLAAQSASNPLAAQSAAELFGKPVAPFTLAAEAVTTPVLGVPVDVRITVETRADLTDIEVRISAADGLSLDVADYTLYAPAATADRPAEWVISVVPAEEGAHRLLLFGEALVGGTRQGRSAVATIRVGDVGGESGAGQTEQRAAEQRGGSEQPVGSRESGESGESRESRESGERGESGESEESEESEASGGRGAAREGGRDARADSDSAVRAAPEPVAEPVIRLPATVRP